MQHSAHALRIAAACGALALVVGCTKILGDFTDGDGPSTDTDAAIDAPIDSTPAGDGGAMDARIDAACVSGETSCESNEVCVSGVCECATHFTQCGGTCVDTTSDNANCGRCGHSCLAGSCATSACGAFAILGSADGGVSANALAADSRFLVWTDFPLALQELELDGGGGTVLTDTPTPTAYVGPALSNGTVAWITSQNIYTAPEGTTTGTLGPMLPTAGDPSIAMALNPTATIAFVASQGSASPYAVSLLSCPLGAFGCQNLGAMEGSTTESSPGSYGGMFATANYVYWTYITNPQQAYSVSSWNLTTNAISTVPLTSAANIDNSFAIDATNVYFVASPTFTVYKLPLLFASNAVPTNVTSSGDIILSLASDGTNLYFGTQSIRATRRFRSHRSLAGPRPPSTHRAPLARVLAISRWRAGRSTSSRSRSPPERPRRCEGLPRPRPQRLLCFARP